MAVSATRSALTASSLPPSCLRTQTDSSSFLTSTSAAGRSTLLKKVSSVARSAPLSIAVTEAVTVRIIAYSQVGASCCHCIGCLPSGPQWLRNAARCETREASFRPNFSAPGLNHMPPVCSASFT